MKAIQLREQLHAAGPWPLHLFKQSSALKKLIASTDDPEAAAVLAEAVDAGHRLAGKIKPVLASATSGAWIECLCGLWAGKRQDWLGQAIRSNRWKSTTGGVDTLCALKTGQVGDLPTDPQSATAVLKSLDGPDNDVRAGVLSYIRRVPDLEAVNDAIYGALQRTGNEELLRFVSSERRVPGRIDSDYARLALRAGLEERLPIDPQAAASVLALASDDAIPATAIATYAGRLPDDSGSNDLIYATLVETRSVELERLVRDQRRLPGSLDQAKAWWALKVGLGGELPTTPQAAASVLSLTTDDDEAVRAGVVAYASRLPDEARANDALYDAWIRSQSQEMREVLTSQQRLPSSVAKETLLRLSMGDAEGYLALDDENGQIFREAWGLAPDPLRQLVVQTVTRSGNSRLIDAYTHALGSSGTDANIALEARKTAGDEDGLFEACRPLKILDLLDECSRWADGGRLPEDPARKRAVDNALAAWQEVGRIEFEEAPQLPEGLVDFFEADLESRIDSPDPLMRLHAAVNGKGTVDPKQWIKSEAWPERLAARLLDPELAGTPDHVEWTSLAGGVISNAIFATTAEGTPAEHETLLELRKANDGRNDRAAALNHGLAGVLVAFQSHFQRGAIYTEADDSADDEAAIQVGGEAKAEDLEF